MTSKQPRNTRQKLASGAVATLLTAAVCTGTTALHSAPAADQPTGHVTTIDMTSHQLRATDNGRTVAVFPAGFGKSGFLTRAGTYHVLGKNSLVDMTSCSAGITCDPNSRNYYDVEAPWAVRLTSEGLFVHAAPWDNTIGKTDISHGCIHLSMADAKWFYDFSQVGDTVIVK